MAVDFSFEDVHVLSCSIPKAKNQAKSNFSATFRLGGPAEWRQVCEGRASRTCMADAAWISRIRAVNMVRKRVPRSAMMPHVPSRHLDGTLIERRRVSIQSTEHRTPSH